MFPKLLHPLSAVAALLLSIAAHAEGQGQTVQDQTAQGRANAPVFRLELNGAAPEGDACRLTFVATNDLGATLEASGFEMVLFDAKGMVDRMTVFDFGRMPRGKTLVKRFDVPKTDCAGLSRILVNGAARCEGEGIDARTCGDALATGNKTELAFSK
ncbi:hypothetical protein [Consotaella salsifontis]|uniref:Tat pathway signal sequence domain protein n=1 Tax=Consotaella salsifontis TaxID=1365950 RepID=A0A1T4TE71_9HYPH|nr:hypothetical protein [Consotaella salsifontis]SKA38737.1 hypothetical protein SAMN05428963_1268 [Consotaella salsifontis]